MAGASLIALIDDIASVLDDVAVLTKAATKKTAGVLGDDLALNAQQVTGVSPERELPVVWAVAKGSLLNKAILVPLALLISAFAPWAVTPLLMIGGAFLCYEGAEKLAHRFLHSRQQDQAERAELSRALADPAVDPVAFEQAKIKGAIRTDFVLSAEIIAITLGTVAQAPFGTRVAVLVGIALLMTVGVYGFVAGIVKLDDAGLHLSRSAGADAWAAAQARVRPRHPACRAVADEDAVGGRHRRHVPGGRRHPHARRCRGCTIWIEGAGRTGRRTAGAGRRAAGAGAEPAGCAGGRRRRRIGVAGRKRRKQASRPRLMAAAAAR